VCKHCPGDPKSTVGEDAEPVSKRWFYVVYKNRRLTIGMVFA